MGRTSGFVATGVGDCDRPKQVQTSRSFSGTNPGLGLPLERLTVASLERKMPGLSKNIRLALGASEDHWVDNEKLTPARHPSRSPPGGEISISLQRCRTWSSATTPVEAVHTRTWLYSTARPRCFRQACSVLAAGCWSAGLAAQAGLQLAMQPCRGQMMEFESPREIPHVVRAGTHYLVPRSARRVVVGTTAEYAGFEKRVTAEGLQSILNGVMKFAPFLKECAFLRSWAGLRPDTSESASHSRC